MRRHTIEPTVFVVSRGKNGSVNIMAAGWNVKCSYNPPMMAVALKNDKHTNALIQETREFVLAVPSPEMKEDLEYVGSVSGAQENKLEHSHLSLKKASEVQVPLLLEARVNFECTLHEIVPTGDHFLCIGNVVAAHYNPNKEQLYFAGRDQEGSRVFKSIRTEFLDDKELL